MEMFFKVLFAIKKTMPISNCSFNFIDENLSINLNKSETSKIEF